MSRRPDFEALVLPHLDAAYNLARWLLRDEAAAQDAVQEASMRALRYFERLRGDDARPWLLGIVRNTCYTQLERRRHAADEIDFDSAEFEAHAAARDAGAGPEALLSRERTRRQVDAAIRALAPALREVVVLREFEDLDVATIARIVDAPVGTVMSRLARARERLRAALAATLIGE
ncbi:MAG: sigma-70 family RNA polymerase sigma factor [Burkholderiales bacterium]|nr:sigma-70 family RNA polymerase sigma factor [Burkholderiales bacterium]